MVGFGFRRRLSGGRIGDTLHAELQQMLCKKVTVGEIVDSNHVEAASVQKWADVSIEKNHCNTRAPEAFRDTPVCALFVRVIFESSKENAAQLLFDEAFIKELCFLEALPVWRRSCEFCMPCRNSG